MAFTIVKTDLDQGRIRCFGNFATQEEAQAALSSMVPAVERAYPESEVEYESEDDITVSDSNGDAVAEYVVTFLLDRIEDFV